MRKFTIGLGACLLFFTACLKDEDAPRCVTKTLEQDMPGMTRFAADSSITTVQDESGLLYEIIDAGSDVKPALSSTITIKYVGRRLNGEKFDESNSLRYQLSNLIAGWQIGMPKIGVGGKIKLIIPSALAYGCYTLDPAVSNQPLYFYVELLKVE